MEIIDLKPTEMVELSPAEFIEMNDAERGKFSSFAIVPPRLGEDGFGFVQGKLKVPVYHVPMEGVET